MNQHRNAADAPALPAATMVRLVETWQGTAASFAELWLELSLAPFGRSAASRSVRALRRWTDMQRSIVADSLALAERGETAFRTLDGRQPGALMQSALTQAAERLVHSQADWAEAWSAAREDLLQRGEAGEADATPPPVTPLQPAQAPRSPGAGRRGSAPR